MRRKAFWIPLMAFILPVQCGGDLNGGVRTGAEVFLSQGLSALDGKRVGLITNHTGRLPRGEMLTDVLIENGVNIVALFAPEHGIRGTAEAGEYVEDRKDPVTGITVHSLHGKNRKPTEEMLQGVDLLIYDIQDVGVRFYTYISTMGLAMEAARDRSIPFIVLDRPNPLGGRRVEGPVLDDSLRSFLGLFPIPVIYGLTCGELAMMIAGEGWLSHGTKPDLTVIPMEGWRRDMDWAATGLEWIPTSPNIPDPATVLLYPATCYIEATNLSEGRGTEEPFRVVGAPFVNSRELQGVMADRRLPGVKVEAATFVPSSSKHTGERCNGVRFSIMDPDEYNAVRTGFALLSSLMDLYAAELTVDQGGLERLSGSGMGVSELLRGTGIEDLEVYLDLGVEEFLQRSSAYRLYE